MLLLPILITNIGWFCQNRQANFILRGVRSQADFIYEQGCVISIVISIKLLLPFSYATP
jgi:hypothetical protein